MNRDGTDLSEIETPFPIEGTNDLDLDFSWSPDGTAVLYMRGKRLYKINIDGTGIELFAQLNNEEFVEVAWSGPTALVAARTVADLRINQDLAL